MLLLLALSVAGAQNQPPSFELLTHRMDADCDGAPRAYGPPGKPALDYLRNGRTLGNPRAPIVGYLTEDDHPNVPVLQGAHDPAHGYYISQTAWTDPALTDERDVRRYLDATQINYVVLGHAARSRGARIGDFVAVHSYRTGHSVYAIIGDSGNPSGDEGSLHLLQELGYAFHNCKRESVEDADVVIRFYPRSNSKSFFPHTQIELDDTAHRLGLSRDFVPHPPAPPSHRTKRK